MIQNTFEGSAILLLLGTEDKSFRAWDRTVGNRTLDFMRNDSTNLVMDMQTMSSWADHGKCLSGEMKGTQLKGIQAYQQYWHSWQDFHPNTSRYPE